MKFMIRQWIKSTFRGLFLHRLFLTHEDSESGVDATKITVLWMAEALSGIWEPQNCDTNDSLS